LAILSWITFEMIQRKIEKAVQIDDEDEYENDFKEAAPFKTKVDSND